MDADIVMFGVHPEMVHRGVCKTLLCLCHHMELKDPELDKSDLVWDFRGLWTASLNGLDKTMKLQPADHIFGGTLLRWWSG